MALQLENPPWFEDQRFEEAVGQTPEEKQRLHQFDSYLGQRRLVIIDPALHGTVGHHFNHDRALVEAARRQNIPVLVFGFHRCEDRVLQTLPMVRHFGIQPYAKPHWHTSSDEDFATLNEAFLHYMVNLPLKLTERDIVLFPTVNQNQLLAIPTWMINGLARDGCPQVVVGLMFPPDWVPWTERDDTQEALYKRAFQSWPQPVRQRLRLVAETSGVARIYREMSGLPVSVRPAPTISVGHDVPTEPVQCQQGQHIIGYMGHARREKGAHLIADIARIVEASDRNIRFRVQMNYPMECPLTREARLAMLELRNVLPLSLGPLEEDAYVRFIDQCHVMLLPYSPFRYRTRGSGLLREAIQRGRPVVVPKYTEMGAWVERTGVGTVFAEYTAQSIANAVLEATQKHATLNRVAADIQKGFDPHKDADDYVRYLTQVGAA